MPGLSDTWIDLGAQRRVTLTNLDAGDHVLEVRAAASGSDWSAQPLSLDDSPRAGAMAFRLGVRRIRAACIRRHRRPHPPTTAEVHRGGARTRAARARSATAHARARRQQPATRRGGAREEQLSRSDEPRAAHADERRRRHDGAAFAHGSLRDSDASHADNPFVRADPAADRERLARPVEDSRGQGRARSRCRSISARCSRSAPASSRDRPKPKASSSSSVRRPRTTGCCSATRCGCGRF